ncbi:hypothetical protein [Capnocytophaga catalasegens]|uniref:Type VI secretion system effector TseH-like domain-containing protein n=1 Tax=Capnocytophaga catalasegens TaxID=1004260 RepID=A0AAV5AZN1_9FLAO|nr:hypothetical protein [Capnocytophaga catalasegens]GIZ14227.1 hypothetical protein RCZ03_02280 [Capnocytophaga catalasegens]GJM50407.1 hypothetical protein RCZ15_13800 [Capnocytophaga catalasegens]GJM52690.1 hypothetical protein RCZ16_10070 [Capnocytophaga catalasegens]
MHLKDDNGTIIQTKTATLTILHKGVAIYIAFPDYKADPEINIPLPKGKNIKIPKIETGHAGILLIESDGYTAYYEYGRYPHSWDKTKGYVRRKTVPNVKWNGSGLIDISELNKVLSKISQQSGDNGNIIGAYIETNYINRMLSYAEQKHIESVPNDINDPTPHKHHAKDYENIEHIEYSKDRKEYNLFSNNCGTFALDVIRADENVASPWVVIKTTPNDILEEFFDEGHKRVFYNSKTKETILE